MPTRPDSPDPTGQNPNDPLNPFAGLGSGMGAGLGFFQDWLKAAGSALPNLSGTTGAQGAAMPAWSMPTLDPEELDKRIQDLKTVQFWLEQNARMIAMSIQGLEVQRMTLSTLQGMNVSMDALRESLKAKPSASAWGSPAAQAPSPAPAPAPAPRASWASPPPAPPPPPTAEDAGGSDDAPPAQAGADEASAADATLINPMRWWDTLTQQFTHLAAQAAQTVGDSVGAASQASAKKSPSKAKTKAKSAAQAGSTGSASSATAKRPAAKKARAASPSPRTRSAR